MGTAMNATMHNVRRTFRAHRTAVRADGSANRVALAVGGAAAAVGVASALASWAFFFVPLRSRQGSGTVVRSSASVDLHELQFEVTLELRPSSVFHGS